MAVNENNTERQEETGVINLSFLWYYLKKSILWILIAAIAGVGLGYLYSNLFEADQYSASANIYMPNTGSASLDIASLNISKGILPDCIVIMKSRAIIDGNGVEGEGAIARAKRYAEDDGKALSKSFSYGEVIGGLSISIATAGGDNTHILVVSLTTGDPQDAKYLVNAIADESAIMLPAIMNIKSPSVYQKSTGGYHIGPDRTRTAIIAGVIIAAIVAAVFFVRMLVDTTIRNHDDIERYLNLTTLGMISDKNKLKGSKYGYKHSYTYGRKGGNEHAKN